MADNPIDEDQAIAARIAPVMAAAADRIHYAESRRANYSVMAGVLVAAGIAIFTFAFGSIDSEWLRDGAVGCSVTMLIVGSAVLYLFGQQTNRYPFTGATKTWKWFYRDALPDQAAFNLIPWKSWASQKETAQKAYAEQLPKFEKKMRDLSDSKVDLAQDIQQLYILHINEKYKNLHLSALRSWFNRGILAIGAITAASIGGGFYAQWSAHQPQTECFDGASVETCVDRRLISPSLDESKTYSIRIRIDNKSKKPLTLKNIVALDESGWPLPYQVDHDEKWPVVVEAQQRKSLFATLKSEHKTAQKLVTVSPQIQ